MKLDILAFAAHPDDVELSCSGTIMKQIAQGKTVGIVDLTEGGLGSRGSIELRYQEAKAASEIMGISARENLQLPDGFFEINDDALMKVIAQIRRFQPEIVLANAVEDRHPDHGRAAALVSRACFLSGLRKIETTWEGKAQVAHRPKTVYHYIQDHFIKPDLVVDVTEYVPRKNLTIKAFKSQFYDPNSNEPQTPISGEEFFDFIHGRMAEMGRMIGARYGEGFTVERPVGVEDLTSLR